jgi:hypothetical protein
VLQHNGERVVSEISAVSSDVALLREASRFLRLLPRPIEAGEGGAATCAPPLADLDR